MKISNNPKLLIRRKDLNWDDLSLLKMNGICEDSEWEEILGTVKEDSIVN